MDEETAYLHTRYQELRMLSHVLSRSYLWYA